MKRKREDSNLIPEKLKFIADLARTSAWIANRYTVFLKPFGISTQQLNILRVLRTAREWLAMHEVNELMIVKSPNITRLANKLLAHGLIERKRCTEDRRVVYIKIENAGLDLLARIDNEHEGELSDYMDAFTKEEAITMTELLKKIRT